MIRNKTVAELEELGFQVSVHYHSPTATAEIEPVKIEPAKTEPVKNPAKTEPVKNPAKTKPPKFPTKDELLVAIRREMVRISKKTSKLEALAEVKKLGYDKLSEIPGSGFADVLAALKEVE